MRHVEKDVMLRTLDQHWREHLAAMDYLRQGIHLRGYAQKDYRFEYKREAFELFSAMLDRVKFDTVSVVAKVEIRTQEEVDREEDQRRERADAGAAGPARGGRNRRCWRAEPAPPRRAAGCCRAAGMAACRRPSRASPARAPMAARPSSATIARWAATSPVRAARARNSSTVTAPCPAVA